MRYKNDELQKYLRTDIIGEGSYASVYRGRDRVTDRWVALKQMCFSTAVDDHKNKHIGVPLSAARELFILKKLNNKNIVKLIDCFYTFESITLVFEYLDKDLRSYIQMSSKSLKKREIKDIIKQIISGVNYIHKLNIIHRDLKPSNILISNQKEIKIADFGMAIPFLSVKKMATDIVTLGYRSPELLLGASVYDHSIDIWSVGCIFAELANDGIPIFSSLTIDGQLKQIFCMLGFPSKTEWPDFESLPKSAEFIGKPIKKVVIESIEKRLDPLGTSLLHDLLTLNPKKRITATNAMINEYFINS